MSIVRPVPPKFLLLLFLTAFFGLLAAVWGRIGLSDQELLANYAKAMDYAAGFRNAGGWSWWTAFFNSGQSQAPALGTLFAYLPLILFSPLGPWVGSKAAVLIFGAAGSLAMFALVKALTRSEWTALASALLYVLCPQFALRAAWNEHLVVLFCFPYPPLMCWALLRMSRGPSLGAVLILGMATAAMFLTYAKVALVFLPALLLFALWLAGRNGEKPGIFWREVLKAVGFFIPLAVLPLLPALRESGGLCLFEFDPLAAWQQSFSIRSPLSLLDRGGWLLQGLALDRGGSFVGGVAILGFGWILFRRKEWSRSSREAGPLRIFLAMALLLFWFSLGPDGLFLSHWRLLGMAQGMRDWSIPILWLSLALPGFLILRFWPWSHRGAGMAFLVLLVAAFYLLPGFRVFEFFTGVSDIRAPWSFWQVGGSFTLAVAGGLSLKPLFQALQSQREKIGLGLVLAALAFLDASIYEREFFKPGLEEGTAEDFREVQDYLAGAPVEGSVMAVSGRYFYLMTPIMSGRPLVMEAFQSYLMPRYTKTLINAASGNPDLLMDYLKNAGVAYILLDKLDPDLDRQAADFFRRILPVTFENKHFLLSENRASLAPAFFAEQIILFPTGDGFEDEILSKAGLRNFLAIPTDEENPALPGIAGKLNPGDKPGQGEFQMEDAFRSGKGMAFQRLPVAERKNPQQIHLKVDLPKTGWVTIPESFHRDWTAEVNGKAVQVYRGMGAFLSVPVGMGAQEIGFFFKPPFWYPLFAWIAAAGWLMALAVLSAGLCFRKFRCGFFGAGTEDGLPADKMEIALAPPKANRSVIKKALVVVPCYNEAISIGETLRQILVQQSVEVLVVDDASPDGTAKIVESQANFGSRIHLLKRGGKLGLASAYKEAFAWALARDYDAILEIDADLSHDPGDIARLIAALDEGIDLAIGSRYLEGVRVLNWPQHRLLLSLFAGVYTRFFTSLPLTDPTSGFKAIRREVLESMNWKNFTAEGYGFQIELHVRAWRREFVLKEVPIVFTERRSGASKMSRQIAGEAALRVLQLALENKERENP